MSWRCGDVHNTAKNIDFNRWKQMPKILDSRFHGFNSGTEVFTMELEYWIFRQAEDELERRKLILEEKKYR